MSGILKIKKILGSPFLGSCDPIKELGVMTLVGLFVALFLYFFEPFDINRYQGNLMVLTTSFGMATFVGGYLYFIISTYVFGIKQDDPSFVVWKWIIYALLLIVSITFCNYLVLWWFTSGQQPFNWQVFINLLLKTTGIGLFPIAVSGLITYYRNYTLFEEKAAEMHPAPYDDVQGNEVINIPSHYSEDFSCAINEIYVLESQDNYVAVKYRANGDLKISLIRNTLSGVEDSLPSNTFFRCHRSFIANLTKVENISGNAQGLLIRLKDVGLEIPVSRSYINDLKSLMNSNS